MSAAPNGPRFNRDFSPTAGEAVPILPGVARITAANRGPYTFTGTNSFLLGTDRIAVLDPGPDRPDHFDALLKAIRGRKVEAILLTHTHKDHSGLARRLQQVTGAPLWFEGAHRLSRPRRKFEHNAVARACDWDVLPDRRLADAERFEVAGLTLEAVATPGHCANHLCYALVGHDAMFSGDHVMGWNSSLVSVPDGDMADYLASLRKVIGLPYRTYLPAHGGPISDGPEFGRALLAHREQRNQQIIEAIDQGARRSGQLLRALYPELGLALIPAARMVIKAHVEYLAGLGQIVVTRGPLGLGLAPKG